MPRFATPADLAAYLGTPDATGSEAAAQQAQLDRAADVVARATRTSRVALSSEGIPTAPAIAAAYTRMTCAQVAYWQESLDETGAAGEFGTVTMAGVTLSRGTGGQGGQHPAGSRLAPAALDIGRTAGLFSAAVRH